VRRAALALLAAAVLAGAGCGGDDDGGGDGPGQLMDRGFATDVDSGVLTFEAELELEGAQLDGPFRLELEGPFQSAETINEWPDMEMEWLASGAGEQYEGSVVTTRANAWIEFEGVTYEIGESLWRKLLFGLAQYNRTEPDTWEELEIDPLDWITGARRAGKEKVGGDATTKVTGSLDADRMVRDLNELPGDRFTESELEKIEDVVGDTDFQAWIGEDDIWRRLWIESELRVPEADREAVGGITGGKLSLDFQLDDPNEPVEIEAPADGRPIDELLSRLGLPPEDLLGPGYEQPAPG
jgi:hypothetical protein